MHYLEDYLELLEPLREIMREKLTLMRENDLKFQVDFAQLEEDSTKFLNNYRLYQKQSLLSPTKSKINIHQLSTSNNLNEQLTSEQLIAQQEKQHEYDKIIQRHKDLQKITNTKINLANESHDFVEKYFKKLENDLHKFKMELEADYAGVTEILEKRFADQDCNEYVDDNNTFDPTLLDIEPLFDSYDDLTMSNTLTDDYTNSCLSSQTRRLSNGLTPCMLNRKQPQRFHSSSSSSRGRKRLQDANNIDKRKRSLIPHSFLSNTQYLNPIDSDELSTNNYLNLNHSISLTSLFDDETNLLTNFNGQLTETLDERRYCFCNEMSYGDMIACDNRNCRREWFHYSCVGIITPPKGKWFCTDCSQIVQQKLQISNTKRA